MAHSNGINKGAWTAAEDCILRSLVEKHGPRRWETLAGISGSGLNRCGKSCRLRWLNYLRPDIKRGDISDAEEDLIIRLHRLLGNRWSLIASRLPGRTDNEIKNYWNAHLKKKAKSSLSMDTLSTQAPTMAPDQAIWLGNLIVDDSEEGGEEEMVMETSSSSNQAIELNSNNVDDQSFGFSNERCNRLDWVKSFLELEQDDN